MIYRILVQKYKGDILFGIIFGKVTVAFGGCWGVLDMPFKMPKAKYLNRRARFYFTEKGWNLHGRDMCKQAYEWGYRNGYNIRVIRRKNPRRSEIAYRDDIQVSLLPSRGKKKYRDKFR